MSFNHVAIIGLGLLGGSIGLAVRQYLPETQTTGFDIDPDVRRRARERQLADRVCDTLTDAVEGADLVILCVPVGRMGEVAAEMAPALSPDTVVSDVGSSKRSVMGALRKALPDARIIPAHPVAGTEHSGPESGFAELFDKRWTLLVPVEGSDRAAVARLRKLWEGLGAFVEEMEPDHHDLVLAVTSHAPHLIAYTMVGVADDLRRVTDSEVIKYSAAGFRDFTRIAASDPTMWRDVFLNNKDATLEILGRFTEELFALQRAIRRGDGDHLHAYFTRTRAIRRSIIEAGQDTDAPDFGRGPKR